MIYYLDENFVLTAFKIVPPGLEGLNNGEELTVMSFIPSFGQ